MIVRTTRLPLASFWLNEGLRYIQTSAVEDTRCVFEFMDDDGKEPELTRRFFSDEKMRRYLRARVALCRSLTIAKKSPERRCVALPSGHGATR